jgi:hypothetical protein
MNIDIEIVKRKSIWIFSWFVVLQVLRLFSNALIARILEQKTLQISEGFEGWIIELVTYLLYNSILALVIFIDIKGSRKFAFSLAILTLFHSVYGLCFYLLTLFIPKTQFINAKQNH